MSASLARHARRAVAAAALILAPPLAAPPAGAVDIELVLAVDASASVDYREFDLQMAGYAAAFRNREFIEAIEAFAPGGVAVCLLQWAGPGRSRVAVDWSILRDGPTSAAFADAIDVTPRAVRGGSTAIGDAVAHAIELIRGNGIEGRRRVIDLSGDGRANDGSGIDAPRRRAERLGIAINGLAILNEQPDLARYYARAVVTGPPAFVEIAEDYDDFAAAIRRKLVREVRGAAVAAVPAPLFAESVPGAGAVPGPVRP